MGYIGWSEGGRNSEINPITIFSNFCGYIFHKILKSTFAKNVFCVFFVDNQILNSIKTKLNTLVKDNRYTPNVSTTNCSPPQL